MFTMSSISVKFVICVIHFTDRDRVRLHFYAFFRERDVRPAVRHGRMSLPKSRGLPGRLKATVWRPTCEELCIRSASEVAACFHLFQPKSGVLWCWFRSCVM